MSDLPANNGVQPPRLVIATHNQGKLREYKRLLADVPIELISLDDTDQHDIDIEETGTTFETNASLKARGYALAVRGWALADDSGLEVDALNGEPGVYSARYGGADLDDAGRRRYLLHQMRGIPPAERTARFVCVIVIANPQGEVRHTARGTVEGHILETERDGGAGFGYDALFQPAGYDLSFAELPAEAKNRISHRGAAARALLPHLGALLSEL